MAYEGAFYQPRMARRHMVKRALHMEVLELMAKGKFSSLQPEMLSIAFYILAPD